MALPVAAMGGVALFVLTSLFSDIETDFTRTRVALLEDAAETKLATQVSAWGASMSESPVLTAGERQMIVSTYRLIVPISETVGDLFYRRLFEEQPRYRELFPDDMAKQKQKLMSMLAFITKSLDWTEEQWQEEVRAEEDLFLIVLALGRRHHSLYKIPDEAYEPVERSLLWALDQGLGQAFTPELRQAWTKLYRALATSMQLGAKSSRINPEFGRIS